MFVDTREVCAAQPGGLKAEAQHKQPKADADRGNARGGGTWWQRAAGVEQRGELKRVAGGTPPGVAFLYHHWLMHHTTA